MKENLLNTDENIVAKGEISHHEQFLLLAQWFQKSSAAEALESACVWDRVKIDKGITVTRGTVKYFLQNILFSTILYWLPLSRW